MATGIIIQARTGSTRMENKILLPFHEGKSILEILVGNIKSAFPDMTTILATTNNPRDNILEDMAAGLGIECYRGEEDDVLKRFIDAAERFNIDLLIRVCSDNPFLQVHSFTELFKEYSATPADYISYGFPDGRPTIKSHLGLFSELTTLETLKRVSALTDEKLYHEHVTNYIYSHPAEFYVRLLPLPEYLSQRSDLRFTLDTPEDFSLLQELYASWTAQNVLTIPALLSIVASKPEYGRIMSSNISHNEK